MNYLILSLHGLVNRKKLTQKRLLCVSAIGTLLGVCIVVLRISENKMIFIVIYIFVATLLMYFLYGKSTIRQMVRYLLLYYGIGCMVAGVMLWLKGMAGGGEYSMAGLLITAIFLYGFLKRWIPKLYRYGKTCEDSYPVKVMFRKETFSGTGFVDTGNCLVEPISGEAVHVIDYSLIRSAFTEEEQTIMENMILKDDFTVTNTDLLTKDGLRVIPFHSIGKSLGIMPGIKIDCLLIWKEGKWEKKEKQWLAVSMENIAQCKEYQILLNREIL